MLSALIRQSAASFGSEFSRSVGNVALRATPIGKYQRKIAVDFKVRSFRVKTIENASELKDVLTLRRSVFHFEFAGKRISFATDRDQFDLGADHLAIYDESKGVVVGVYRLMASTYCEQFYSQTEFDLGTFPSIPGSKLELSRACIDRNYRNGIVIGLLWKGLAEYAKEAKIDYLFGLSSVNTTNVDKIRQLHQFFCASGSLDLSNGITPRSAFKIPEIGQESWSKKVEPSNTADAETNQAIELLPPLFKTYLKAGAKVCSLPVIDRDFACADWLTILNMGQLSGAFDRRFMKA